MPHAAAASDNHKKAKPAIEILPESDNHTLCLSLRGVVSRDEYSKQVFNPLQKWVDSDEKFNLLINYEKDYQGWDMDAADLSMRSIIDHGKFARRVAYVNPPESKIFQVKMARPLIPGEVRFFNRDELDEAVEWVKAD